jgi:type 1 glutamine amidotransferase
MRVSLVSRMTDNRSVAAFERILAENGDVPCNRVDLASAEREGLANADCAVVFGRGLQIVGRWSAFDADAIEQGDFGEDEGSETEVEIAAAARWHPVVDGVGPFIARNRSSHSFHLHTDVTHLLVRKWAGRVFPVAWARQGDGRAFCTLLGHPEDFRRREFVRMLLNAIEWVRR